MRQAERSAERTHRLGFRCAFGAQAMIDGGDRERGKIGPPGNGGKQQRQRVGTAGDGEKEAGRDAARAVDDAECGGQRLSDAVSHAGSACPRCRTLDQEQRADFSSTSSLRFTLALIAG